jgi:hypothetical protein
MKPGSGNRVIVCPASARCAARAKKALGSGFRWAYFGEDASKAEELGRRIGSAGERILIADMLQKAASRLRQPYIDYIGKMSLKNSSMQWWAGSVSEKNPNISKAFLNICYAAVCRELLGRRPGDMVIFAERRCLRKCITKNFPGGRNRMTLEEPLSESAADMLRDVSKLVKHKGFFLANTVYRILVARRYGMGSLKVKGGKGGTVLIHAWIDRRSFGPDGRFRDQWFLGLKDHLKKKGRNVVMVPYVLGMVSYRDSIRRMKECGEQFLVPEAFLSITGTIRMALGTLAAVPKRRRYPKLDRIDVSDIMHDDARNDWMDKRPASSMMLREAVRNWRMAGLPVDSFIYPFENHTWEKVYCMALREFYPSAEITGYQHSIAPEMLLNYFFSKEETPVLPFPDRVITTGMTTERLFKRSGYSPKAVVRGGAIRFSYLTEPGSITRKVPRKPVVLVAFSFSRNETIELYSKVKEALGKAGGHIVVLKFHPDVPYDYVADDIGALPENFSVSDRPIRELLSESTCLVYTTSSASLEALYLGIPVLRVKSDLMIDRSPVPFGLGLCAKDGRGIRKEVDSMVKMAQRELSSKRKSWRSAVTETLSQADKSTFDLFTGGLKY